MRLRDHLVRSVLLLLVAVPQALTGLWAVVASRGWYDNFPGFGRDWVAAYGPYDDHLVADAGAGLLAVGLLLAGAAIVAPRAELRRALGVFLLFAGVHLAYHLRALGRLPRLDDTLSIASLVLAVVVPLGVLLTVLESGRPAPAAEAC